MSHQLPTADMLAQRRRDRWDNQRAETRAKHMEEASPLAEEQQEQELMPPPRLPPPAPLPPER